jgi:hypothetical protein
MTITAIPYLRRLAGALALDPAAYEEVEADLGATPAALATVVLASVATGVGLSAAGGARGIAALAAIALLAWALWALLVFEIGARLFPSALTRADVGQLLRTLGFAAAPGMLNLFGVVPGLAAPLFAVTQIWILLAIVVAVRQALDYTNTFRAIAVCAGAWVLSTALVLVWGFFLGPLVR